MHRLAVVTACLGLSIVHVAPVFADQSCKPVVGHFEASLVPPGQDFCPPDPGALCTAGRVWGGIQGSYQFVITGAIDSSTIGGVPGILFFTGRSVVSLKNGDELRGTDTGSLDLGRGGFASLITFSGGTGNMVNATGQIRLRGDYDAVAATTSGDYLGTLCSQ